MASPFTHGLLNAFSWGFLADIGIVINRTLRARKLKIHYQILHFIFQFSAFLVYFFAVYLIVSRYGITIDYNNRTLATHKVIGYTVCFLSMFEVIFGLTAFFKLRSYSSNESSHRIRQAHRFTGYLLYILTKINLMIGGLANGSPGWIVGLGLYIILLVWIHYKIHISYKEFVKRFEVIKKNTKGSNKTVHQEILRALECGKSRWDIINQYPEVKWVIYGNKVYDMTGWIHPGGNFLIEAVVGREISRFLHGAYGLESTSMQPHTHSTFALELLEEFYIGRLNNMESILIPNFSENNSTISNDDSFSGSVSLDSSKLDLSLPLIIELDAPPDESSKKKRWKLIKRTDLTGNATRFDFQSDDYKVKLFGNGISWFGRHFIVNFAGQLTPTRTYTTCLALTPERTDLRDRLVEFFKKKINSNTEEEFIFPEEYLKPREVLSFFIKKYNFPGGFSEKIHNLKLGDETHEFVIQGPVGRGLELTPFSHGTHYILCAGTGILPFLDLLDCMLYKCILDVLESKGKAGDLAETLRTLGLDFTRGFPSLKIKMVAYFGSLNESYGFDILRKLAELSKKYDLDVFELDMNNFSDEYVQSVPKKFYVGFLERRLFKNCEGYYVCGPPRFNKEILTSLLELEIPPERIIIV